MQEIRSATQEKIDFYRERINEYSRIADACGIASFSLGLRNDLAALSLSVDGIGLIEAVARIGNFGDTDNIAALRKAVSRRVRIAGVRPPRGKRTAPGLLELVSDLAPLLLYFGFPLASSERSRLVRALRMIAEEVGVPGDPRSEVRKLMRQGRIRQESTRRLVFEALAHGLASTRVHQDSAISSSPSEP